MLKNVGDVVQHFKRFFDKFSVQLSNYSLLVETEKEKTLFTDERMNPRTFAFYSMMKKDVGGEIRPAPPKVQYFDFSGLKKRGSYQVDECYSVDINSAYLQVLLNEGIITETTFNKIQSATTKSKTAKQDRLKSVGMFARVKCTILFSGDDEKITTEENFYSWVFYTACHKTGEAMEKVKKEMKNEFLLYWVDGIFLTGNPEKAVSILSGLNFPAKIELIKNLRVEEGSVIYEKDGKTKILFLPRTNKTDANEFRKKTGRAIKL